MNENINKKNDTVEIDLRRLWKAVWRRLWVICLAAVLGAALSLAATYYLVTPMYQSSAMFYVNNSAISMGEASLSITSSDITASKSLVATYSVILKSRTCLDDVIDYANLEYTYEELRKMISASSVNDTEVFQVVVTGPDPAEAERIANAVAYILPNQITDIVEGTSAKIVDYAVAAASPSSPSYVRNVFLGFVIGLGLAGCLIVVRALYDVTIRTEEDIRQCTDHPILAAIPDMEAPSKGEGYYGYGKSQKRSGKHLKKPAASGNAVAVIGKNLNFSAAEAYKLLRTKLQFSFVDEIKCPVIGVSSAMMGEGKSLSSINLAYSLSQLDKKILLVDCDMRRPSLSIKLPIQKVPGLSDYLTGQSGLEDVFQECRIDDEGGFVVISSGHNPPNPLELLSSAKMANAIEQLREYFDYIILDLPPVGEVSDALAAAKLANGTLLVVRQNYCNTHALTNAVNQFDFVQSRILGVLVNGATESSAGYGKKYYKQYYGESYGYSYAAAKNAENTDKKE